MKHSSRIYLQTWEDDSYDYRLYECPHCKANLIVPKEEIDGYNFCPVCGFRRITDDSQ